MSLSGIHDPSEKTGFPTETFGNDGGLIAGVDEAGRGPLAGPVVVAAVVLPESPLIIGLRDSKVVPSEQREALYVEIQSTALAFSISVIEPGIIDSLNILGATLEAMRRAIQSLRVKPDWVLVDGHIKPRSGLRELAIIKGDGKSAAIMAASILAKVMRDRIMTEAHQRYPQYGFDRHKGYGCKQHLEALNKYGPCPLHRKSFEPVKSWLAAPLQEELCLTESQTAASSAEKGSR